ncbi:hypothetical protein SSX86_018677 [Deinandra increscens subsp. villosa]|uniref:TPX2 C-terminal domain-containing protein n=1 Tax=Deinandra increscens subsp. villosa TaxID=3103831 RepID=A0AAP0CR72_9ASTR
MEAGNGVHLEDENGVMNVEINVVNPENSDKVESSKLEVIESSEDVIGAKILNSVEVTTNKGTSKNKKKAKKGPEVSLLARKPKPHLTQSLSFPANGISPANRRASTGVKAKESSPNVRVSRHKKLNGNEDSPPADPLSVAPGGQHKNSVLGFSSRLEERAEKRKEFFSKIEEKIHAKEAEKTNLYEKSKESQEAEIKQLRKSLMFKAAPMPKFYKEPPPKVDLKKIPTTCPKSPKLGRNKSNVAATSNGTSVSPLVTRNKTMSPDVNTINGDKDTAASKKLIRKSQPKTPSCKTEVQPEKSEEKLIQEEEKTCNELTHESSSLNPVVVEG